MSRIAWPGGKSFAFTIFDDTDFATVQNVAPLYSFLHDIGLRTTKSCWPSRGSGQGSCVGATCEDQDYLNWLLDLQAKGFEIGYHLATYHTSSRDQTRAALERFAEVFGPNVGAGANHTGCDESIYWGSARLDGLAKVAYNLLTRWRSVGHYRGHIDGDELFWGDLCRQRVRYFRNFVFRDIDTLAQCPSMPYYDPDRPYVNAWFSSSDGHDLKTFNRCLRESSQDRLEANGGACIMYTHFACGFYRDGKLDPTFERLMRRLAAKNGWFVPAATLLDFLASRAGGSSPRVLTAAEKRAMQWRWLRDKILLGGST